MSHTQATTSTTVMNLSKTRGSTQRMKRRPMATPTTTSRQAIEDPLSAPLRGDDPGFAQDPQVMRHRRLPDIAARREVARARLRLGGQLADDREARRIGQRGEQADVRVEGGGAWAGHDGSISVTFDIDKFRYMVRNSYRWTSIRRQT
jgi:hypothetical protein